MHVVALWNGRAVEIDVVRRDGKVEAVIDGQAHRLDARRVGDDELSILYDNAVFDVLLERSGDRCRVGLRGQTFTFDLLDERRQRMRQRRASLLGDGPEVVRSPMPGRVVRLHVKVGDRVKAGQPLVVVEAMKMENEIKATRDGDVREVGVTAGKAVDAGDTLIVVA